MVLRCLSFCKNGGWGVGCWVARYLRCHVSFLFGKDEVSPLSTRAHPIYHIVIKVKPFSESKAGLGRQGVDRVWWVKSQERIELFLGIATIIDST